MLRKAYIGSGRACRVTFEVTNAQGAAGVTLCGEFNNWDPSVYPMARQDDDSFAITVTLPPGVYRFKYLMDAQRWQNDQAADGYVPNEYGTEDSLVVVQGLP